MSGEPQVGLEDIVRPGTTRALGTFRSAGDRMNITVFPEDAFSAHEYYEIFGAEIGKNIFETRVERLNRELERNLVVQYKIYEMEHRRGRRRFYSDPVEGRDLESEATERIKYDWKLGFRVKDIQEDLAQTFARYDFKLMIYVPLLLRIKTILKILGMVGLVGGRLRILMKQRLERIKRREEIRELTMLARKLKADAKEAEMSFPESAQYQVGRVGRSMCVYGNTNPREASYENTVRICEKLHMSYEDIVIAHLNIIGCNIGA